MQSPATHPTNQNVEVTVSHAWTLFTVKNEICRNDIVQAIDAHFPNLASVDVIWDLSEASLAAMNRADFEAIAIATKKHEAKRQDARTVFVSSNPETFAAICMYTGIAALAEMTVDYSAFSTLEEGERWLVCNRKHK